MKVTISIAQFATIPKEPKKNLAKAKEFIIEAKQRGSDLIVFPEMWTTGFQWDWIKANGIKHNLINEEISHLAMKHKIWILGSTLHVDSHGNKKNRATLHCINGLKVADYDKAHLFPKIKEDIHLQAGSALTTYNHSFGKSGFAICYDIRYPELFRSYALQGVKIAFVMAAFPSPRESAWEILNRARAIENQMFVVCANRVDTDPIPGIGELPCMGHSAIIDPFGNPIIQAGSDEILLTAEIDTSIVDTYRKSFPVLKDRQESLYFKS